MEFKNYLIGFIATCLLCTLAYPFMIRYLRKIKLGQSVSEYMPDQIAKAGTPIMGGILFIIAPFIISFVLFRNIWMDSKVILIALAFIGYGFIGFIDDYIILVTKNNEGLSPKKKLMLQIILSLVFFLLYRQNISSTISIFNLSIDLGVFYIFFVILLFASSTNAVNLTDGMDGLAGGCTFISYIPFVFFALHDGEYNVALFTIMIMGGVLGYLFYNHHPAKIFMGDSGSLALGGVLAALGLVLKRELIVIVIGMVYVIETMSVVLQIASVKLRGKRIFKCSPIHYHFQRSGMSESQVVMMGYAFSILFALLGYFIGK